MVTKQNLHGRETIVFMAAIAVVAALLVACSGAETGAADGTSDEASVVANGDETDSSSPSGTLRIALSAVDFQDPEPGHYQSGNQFHHLQLAFEPLFTSHPDTGELVGHLAEEWQLSDDGLSVEIKVRDGVLFHNGSPLTAEDVAYSIERYSGMHGDIEPLGAARMAAAIDSVDIVDELTVRVNATAEGAPSLLGDLSVNPGAAVGFVVPKDVVEEVGDEAFNRAPVGTGPFQFVSSEEGRSMAYEAFPEYWGDGPYVERVELSIVPEPTTRLSMLESGSTDIIDGVSGPAVGQIEAAPDLEVMASQRAFFTSTSVGGQTNPDSPLSNRDVRTALATGIDRQGIIDQLMDGQGEPASLFSFPGTIGYPNDRASELVWEYDPNAARQLLADAGYEDGFQLELVAPTFGRELAGAVAQNWRDLGVEVSLTTVEIAEALADMQSDERKMATRIIMVWGPSGIPFRLELGGAMETHLSSDRAPHAQPLPNDDVPQLVLEQAQELDQARRDQLIGDALAAAWENANVIPMWYGNSLYGVGPRVAEWDLPEVGAAYLTSVESVRIAE